MTQKSSTSYLTFIGTNTRPPSKSKGIYVARFDSATGVLSVISEIPGLSNPNFLALNSTHTRLYAVTRSDTVQDGTLVAFSIDPDTGHLTKLNEENTKSTGAAHVVVTPGDEMAIVANYAGGAVSVFPLNRDGSVKPVSQVIQHGPGSNAVLQRQDKAHAHSTTLGRSGKHAVVCDLGMDAVVTYTIDAKNARLNLASQVQSAPGAGPRHMTFDPAGKHAYAINELGNTVTAYGFDEATGALREIQTVPTLPAGWTGTNSTSDIHMHSNGRMLYGSNRGHDSIAIFSRDPGTGRVTSLGHAHTKGKTPRNFAIDPTGQWLLAENQDSDTIVTFRIDPKTGMLVDAGHVAQAPTPVCLKFKTR